MHDNQPHIGCAFGDIGKYVILPGDPGRIDMITAYWHQKREVAYNREFRTVSGTVNGIQITATSTGIGCPSAAIAVEELANIGAKTMIRIGTCGGLIPGMKSGDIVIPFAAMRSEGTTKEYVTPDYPAVADLEVTNALIAAANRKGVTCYIGVNRTHDAFHEPLSNFTQLARIKTQQLVRSEMECSAVFLVGALRGIKTGCILVVNTPEPPTEVEKNPEIIYQLAEADIIKASLETATQIVHDAILTLEKCNKSSRDGTDADHPRS
jgi:uridine phosphorylase